MRLNHLFIAPLIPLIAACSYNTPIKSPSAWKIEPVALYDSQQDKGTEIISVQQSTLRAVLSNFTKGSVDILSLEMPEKLQRINRFNLELTSGEELTSVAFHPTEDWFAAVIDAGLKRGRLQIHSATTGRLLDKVELGFGPDAVIFSQDGNTIIVANEGEDFSFEPQTQEFYSAEGSISLLHVDKKGHIKSNNTLELANVKHREGFFVEEKGHYLEREVDWNGDGKITKQTDFDGNGRIDNKKVKLGFFDGNEVFGNEYKGEGKIRLPIASNAETLLEPEYIALSQDGNFAYVTLQETNEVAKIDVKNQLVLGYFYLGIAEHNTDKKADGWVQFNQPIKALREPDGIALTVDGRYFITANEGDTDIDTNGNDSNQEILQSGGRDISIFDSVTGEFISDTGNQLDEMAFQLGVYPDRRSNKKGIEPEMLTGFSMNGESFVAVGMERADAIALIALQNPKKPQVVAVAKIPGEESRSPEGIAHFEKEGQHYILTANEMNGTVACFKIAENQP